MEIPDRLSNLPPLNAIANKVLAFAADADVDLNQIATLMEGDPAFAADVLFLANSPLFGFRSQIQALRHAIAILGLERIKALAVTVAMRSFFGKGSPLFARCWQHSAACAIVAETLSPIFHVKSDVAYTLGLVHDIGRLGLLKSYPSEYAPLFKRPYHTVEEVLCAERALLKCDHAQAGGWMVKAWNYPQPFIETCQRHHEPIAESDSALLQLIKLACCVAETIGHSPVDYTKLVSYDDLIQSLRRHVPRQRFPSEAELRTDVETRLKTISGAGH